MIHIEGIQIGVWDVGLLAAVSLMGTVLAYLHHPRFKALMISLPIPFTMAVLSLGKPVDVTNVMGMLVLLIYTQGVRILYQNLRVPIVLSIAISAGAYCLIGGILARILPTDEVSFWVIWAAVMALGVVLFVTTPHRHEPGHRTTLPVWIKLPIIVCVVTMLVLLKQTLGGFMTLFPMVGVIAAYEARKSLWAVCRQIPTLILTGGPMIAVIHLMQGRVGIGWALAMGWAVMLALLVPLTRLQWADWREDPRASELPG